jgi:hemerythrin-like domain-containing protein
MNEHQTILRALASLEALVSNPAHAGEPVETFREVVNFLRDYADQYHHAKEEDLLFPAMETAGVPPQGPTAVMRMEHEEGRAFVSRMAALSEVEDPEFDRPGFAEPALGFVNLLRAHIGKEDHILYPMAERFIRESDFAQLGLAYKEANARKFEPEMPANWERWAHELATRVGVEQDHYVASPACH